MADVRPFRAVRYARPGAEVTAPPYDVIDDASADALRAHLLASQAWRLVLNAGEQVFEIDRPGQAATSSASKSCAVAHSQIWARLRRGRQLSWQDYRKK